MNISITNGQGGTGKTTSLINLAVARGVPVQFLDCDGKGDHFMGNLPSGRAFIQAKVEGKAILEYDNNNQTKQVLAKIWEKLRQELHPLNLQGPARATARAARP